MLPEVVSGATETSRQEAPEELGPSEMFSTLEVLVGRGMMPAAAVGRLRDPREME